jgi:ABC-type transport system involved in cytochrome c biogenesis permease subunit
LWIFSSSGIAAHALAVIIRITLLGRPPVSNLYETFVFVGFIGAVAGLLIERFNRQGLGFLVSGISGFVFLTIAGKFAADGDTLQMLVAVLNSNFWLSTHVLSITTGYAGVCVAGIVGHVYLLQAAFRPQQKEVLKKTYSVLLGTLAFGLIMTFLGTNLGGIWADQSWGRFWGWDPKENGAMLIVLWTAILFHAKIAKMVNELGMAVGSVLGIIVVMWAWFGVNLLSIGLHSYGFTSGLARNLTIYFVLQLAFIAVIAPLAYKRSKNN